MGGSFMKMTFKPLLLLLVLWQIFGVAIVFADDECADANRRVRGIANSLNRTIKDNVGRGSFDVKKVGDGGPNTRYSITYKINGKKYLQKITIRNPDVDPYEITAGNFEGLSSLIFYHRFGTGVGCGFILYPYATQFNVLQLPYPFSIMDPDKDGNEKIVSQEVEPWSYECEFTNATFPRMPKIFKLDTKGGKLIDVSGMYPEVYKEKYNEYNSETIKEISSLLSPKCKALFATYIDILKMSWSSGKSAALDREKGDFNGDWEGYRIISGQTCPFKMGILQSGNKIEGTSTDLISFGDEEKAVIGNFSGEINGNQVNFTKKWIDHPNGITGESVFVGVFNKQTGTVKGTFKTGNTSGEWYMEIPKGQDYMATWLGPSCPSNITSNLTVKHINPYEGTWIGEYSCRQGITGLQLELKAFSPEHLAGVFTFFPVPSNPKVPFGSFNINGVVHRNGKLLIKAGNWIQRPSGYATVNLEGQISSDSESISGRVSTYGCSGFLVKRKNE
jgi:hypothetical protein